jgi:hypothetical protein
LGNLQQLHTNGNTQPRNADTKPRDIEYLETMQKAKKEEHGTLLCCSSYDQPTVNRDLFKISSNLQKATTYIDTLTSLVYTGHPKVQQMTAQTNPNSTE